ncbi:MAG: flagellar export chaperone FliS [Actinobacteria bacterium]|nr:flagellar export chaperone FliS [Actinomycetota bacterium]
MIADPYRQYQQIKITSSTREDLILLAYDGAIKFINISLKGINEGELEKVHFNSIKAQAIISELMVSLDMDRGGEIAANLYKIYEYMNYRLTVGNAMKDTGPFMEIKNLLFELREAWVEAKKNVS